MTTLQTPLTVATTATANAALASGKHTPVNATAGALTMTLPTPTVVGERLRVEKVDATANAVTVSGNIRGGASTVALAWQFESIEMVAESLTSWRPAAGHKTKAALDAAYETKGAAATAQSAAATDATTKANNAQAFAVQRANHTGTQSADTVTDGTTNKAYTAAEQTKLGGVASGATANSTDAQLRDRSTHTGTQAATTITGLATVAASGAYTDLSGKPDLTIKGDARPAYLGPVANRGRIPVGTTISSDTYRQRMTWRVYRALDKIPAIQLAYTSIVGVSETPATATGTIEASVEYPAGTFTRVTFAGGNQGTVSPANPLIQSDLTTLATIIPNGARFWIGTWDSWTPGGLVPRMQDGMTNDTVAAGQMRESAAGSATTIPNTVMTGVRTQGGVSAKTGDSYGPCAVLGMTQRPTVFIAGDSEGQGQFPPVTSAQDAEGIQGVVEQVLGNRVGYINACLASDAYANANAAYTTRLALSQFCTHVIDQYGVNSIYTQALAANTTDLTTFRAKFPATKPYYKTTCIPKVSGNWILADLSDQTPGGTLANFTAWNQFVRNGANGLIDGCIDLEAVTSASLDTGKVTPALKVVTDAAITSGSGVLTSSTAGFQAGDKGKHVAVLGAGAAAATLYGVIGTVTNTTTVTLTTYDGSALTAGTTVTGATAGLGLSTYDGTHQTRLRESAIRESQLLQRVLGPILAAVR